MVSSISSFITQNNLTGQSRVTSSAGATTIFGKSIETLEQELLAKSLAGTTQGAIASATTEAASTMTNRTVTSAAANAAKAAAQTASSGIKRSFISKLFRVISGDWADDAAKAFVNRKTIPFKEGFKSNFGIEKACEKVVKEGAKKPGVMAKIGNAITRVCPFLKNSKISKAFGFVSKNFTTLLVYGIAAFQIFKSWKKHGSAEGLKETYKFGITTACIMVSELIAAILAAYTGGLAAPLKFFAPIIGSVVGTWLGNKILGKSADEKEAEIAANKQSQIFQELAQNPKFSQMIQQNPKLIEEIQQNPKLAEQIYENLVKQNPTNATTKTNIPQNPFNPTIIPPPQTPSQLTAGQFNNPNQLMNIGTFGSFLPNYNMSFGQMPSNQNTISQTMLLCQQLNNNLAAHGYIFG